MWILMQILLRQVRKNKQVRRRPRRFSASLLTKCMSHWPERALADSGFIRCSLKPYYTPLWTWKETAGDSTSCNTQKESPDFKGVFFSVIDIEACGKFEKYGWIVLHTKLPIFIIVWMNVFPSWSTAYVYLIVQLAPYILWACLESLQPLLLLCYLPATGWNSQIPSF